MEKIIGRTFRDEVVHLDFSIYEKCSFINCVLHTETGHFSLKDSDLVNCNISLGGQARNIALFIKMFYPNLPIV